MEISEDVSVREQIFDKWVRETIICILLFICLYVISHLMIGIFKKNSEFISDNIEDAAVNKIVLWLCTFSLSVCVGAVLLLPVSILSNELLLVYTQSSNMQWLTGSLLHGFWNLVFLFSNVCLVVLLPFAYFLTESEGLPGSRKGVMARVFETGVVLLLLVLLMLGLMWVASAFLHDNIARGGGLCELWQYYLPHFYSGVSLSGVLLLLLCTPFGLSRMLSITRRRLVKPRMRLLEDIEETMGCIVMEEASLIRKLTSETFCLNLNAELLRYQYQSTQIYRTILEIQRTATIWQYNLVYPLAMLLLLPITVMCVLIVCFHVIELLFDETAMPHWVEDPLLGTASFSMFGLFGAVIQVILILYLMTSSVVGFYSSPLFTGLQPRMQDTTIIQIIGNCVSLLVLSSALPAFSRTLGITRCELLGDFGRYNWLANFHVVLLYNLMFVGLTSASLLETLTWTLQRDLGWAFGLHKPSLTVSHSTIPLRIVLANGISKIK